MLSDDFLDTARRLAAGTTEGDWRSAISRAYYACYHYFLDWLKTHGIDLSGSAQAHQSIYRGLNNSGIAALQSIARDYGSLLDQRNKADYQVTRTFSQTQAGKAVQIAANLLDEFEAELQLTPPTTIAAGIRADFVSIGQMRP